MLTFFTIPKAFEGHSDVIQRNALASWKRAAPDAEVIVFGDDPGVDAAAAELGIRHHREIARNELGTPLVSDAFAKAQSIARHDVLCYANSDIIFLDDFAPALAAARAWRASFLLSGRRWNLPVPHPLAFDDGWQSALAARAKNEGVRQDEWWIDYFAFPRGVLRDMPPFAIGRAAWDNWVIYRVRRDGVPVVDASDDILAVHQDHGYQHVPFSQGAWRGPESQRNRDLAGGEKNLYCLADASHRLQRGRISRLYSLQAVRRRLGIVGGLGVGVRLRGLFARGRS